MLYLHADSPSERYALEELHNALGLVCQTPVNFVAGGSEPGGASEAKATVHFLTKGGSEGIPKGVDCRAEDGRLVVRGDLLGFICRTLSREVEKDLPRDALGRARLADDAAYKSGRHQTAYLDRLAAQLAAVLGDYLDERGVAWRRLRVAEQPLVCLTHDVDGMHGRSWVRYAAWAAAALARSGPGGLKKTAGRIAKYRRAHCDPLFPSGMFTQPGGDGFKHTFFVMSLAHSLGREGLRYSLNGSATRAVLRKVLEAGHEMGLHPSRWSQDSPAALRQEKERLIRCLGLDGQDIGVRNHYLKASFPAAWRTAQGLGFKYDSTLGWTEEAGFRAGTARPYQPFDYETGQRLAVWELPLVAMDGAVKGTAEDIASRVTRLAGECFAHDAPATILWHTNRLAPFDFPEHAKAYGDLLAWLAGQGCRGLTAAGVVDCYARHYTDLSRQREARPPA